MGLLAFVLLLTVGSAAAPAPSADPAFDRTMAEALRAYLAALPDNPPAAELARHLASKKRPSFALGLEAKSSSWGRYDPRTRTIFLRRDAFGDAAALESAIERYAPTLVHETAHALDHARQGSYCRAAEETELIAYAYQSWFLSRVRGWDTPERRSAGRRYLEEYVPARDAAEKELDRMSRLSTASDKARRAGRSDEADRLILDAEKALKAGQALQEKAREKARTLMGPLSDYEFQVLGELAAWRAGWDVHRRTVSRGEGTLTVFAPRAKRAAQIAHWNGKWDAFSGDKAAGRLELREMIDEALAFWEDPDRIERAQAHYRRALKPLQAASREAARPARPLTKRRAGATL